YAATYGLEHMGFKVEHADDLELYERKVEKDGGQVTRHARGELAPGHGEAIRFQTPTGHRCELVHGMEKVGNLLPRTNPPPRPMGLVGIAPPRLDHIFVTAEDVDEGTRFFREVLGFRLTEQILADDGHQLATWLEVSHTPHDIALVTGPNGGVHHFAFWLGDWKRGRRPRRPSGLPGGPHGRRPAPPRGHPRLHRLLLRPPRQPQRGVHRRLLGRHQPREPHLARGQEGRGRPHRP